MTSSNDIQNELVRLRAENARFKELLRSTPFTLQVRLTRMIICYVFLHNRLLFQKFFITLDEE